MLMVSYQDEKHKKEETTDHKSVVVGDNQL